MSPKPVEQRFRDFSKSIEPEEFNSADFLTSKANEIEPDDAELAQRILVRVKRLNARQEKKKKNQEFKQPEIAKVVDDKSVATDKSIQEQSGFNILTLFRKRPFVFVVLIPTLVFSMYQLFGATERFESQAQVIVQQPDGMATMDASMMLLSGLGVSNSGVSDTELVKAYILSNDMLIYLDMTLALREHYSQKSIDWFSRLGTTESWEEFLKYYHSHLEVYIDSNSSVVHIYSQAFDSEYAHRLTQTIVERAEWYINSIGHQLAEAQLEFIKQEHKNVEQQLEQAKTTLLTFQQKYNLLDPTAEGIAMQQITYGLEGQISSKEAELNGLLAIMSKKAPQVIAVKNELAALNSQLSKERSKLSDENNQSIPVSEILVSYSDLKVKMELALQAYTSSQVSLEKSRIEAYRQLKYLIVVESATKPEESKYPDTLYNITLFAVLSAMLFAIGRIVLSTIRELR